MGHPGTRRCPRVTTSHIIGHAGQLASFCFLLDHTLPIFLSMRLSADSARAEVEDGVDIYADLDITPSHGQVGQRGNSSQGYCSIRDPLWPQNSWNSSIFHSILSASIFIFSFLHSLYCILVLFGVMDIAKCTGRLVQRASLGTSPKEGLPSLATLGNYYCVDSSTLY